MGREGLEDGAFFAGGDVPFAQLGRKMLDAKLAPTVHGTRDELGTGVRREPRSKELRFEMPTPKNASGKAELVPFYNVGLQRYAIYFAENGPQK